MCGIAGVIGSDQATTYRAAARATVAQTHRGPDAEGLVSLPFGGGYLALGHRRLSILDLSPHAAQPMTDPVSGNVLVFNGEIYNFNELRRILSREGSTFRGTGDTEVLLAALTQWGVLPTLQRLQGMFAFAFYDSRADLVTIARDPLGIKPLYLAETTDGGWVFGSEVRAVLASGVVSPALDRAGLACFLAYGAVQHPSTLHAAVHSLAPGTYQQISTRGNSWAANPAISYWSPPLVCSTITSEEAVDSISVSLSNAVRDHLISDVPIGLFLSAGLDSTIIAGLAAGYSKTLETFTVGFSDSNEGSEVGPAEETARQFDLPHSSIDLTADRAVEWATAWLAAADQPSADGLNTFLICRAVRERGVKVVLSGLGGDELFGGYPSFRDVPKLMAARHRLRWLPAVARRVVAELVTGRKPRAVRRKLSDIMYGAGNLTEIYLQRRRVLSNRELYRLGLDPVLLGLTAGFQPLGSIRPFDEADSVRAISELETMYYQRNTLLRDSDVMSMAHGMELRVPFLDQRVVEAAMTIPGAIRLPPGADGKHLLRLAFRHLLRPQLTARQKTGFVLPLRRWMLGEMRGLCERAISACVEKLGLPANGVASIWAEFVARQDASHWSRALTLVAAGDYANRTWS